MNQYINLLRKNLNNSNIKIISFCIMLNHAHLLINTDNIEDLSTYMHKVNSLYARYYNHMENERVGYVFRDRYKSEPITNRKYLIQCAKYIHQNPVKARIVRNASEYKYSSYNYFRRHKFNHNTFTKEEMEYICNENSICEVDFMDVETNVDEKINKGIEEFVLKENIKIFEIFEKRDILKKLIKFLKFDKKIKYIEIREKFEMTKGIIDRLK